MLTDFNIWKISGNFRKSIIHQFKIDTISRLENENDMSELILSYKNACSDYAKFLQDKLIQINSYRNK